MQLFKPFLFTGRMLSILVEHHITGQLQDHVFIRHFKNVRKYINQPRWVIKFKCMVDNKKYYFQVTDPLELSVFKYILKTSCVCDE